MMRKMRRNLPIIILSILYGTGFLYSKGLKDLPKKYRMWLERDVRYIITDRERKAFLKLKTDKQRELFIKMFWKMRDPTPGTPRNEYKEEHYRRLAMAEKLFRDEGKPGWMTERGKYYILLGKPQDIERYDGMGRFYPVEVWYYQGDPAKGLPSQFRLVFYQDPGTFEYKLYYPGIDAPQKLIPTWGGDPFDKMQGYKVIREYAPSLADALMSMIPGEAPSNYSSARSSLILSEIDRSPYEGVNTEYADRIANMKGMVEVEESVVYVPNQSDIQIFRHPMGFYALHFAISPKKFSITSYENKYYAPLEIYAKLVNSKGEGIWENTQKMDLYFTRGQISLLKKSSVEIEGLIPVVEGDYSLIIILKNKASKEFSMIEKKIKIPPMDRLSVLAFDTSNSVKTVSQGVFLKPFLIGRKQFYPYADGIYKTREKVVVYGQINIPENEDPSKISLLLTLSDEDGNIHREIKIPFLGNRLGTFYYSLGNLRPASYTAKLSLYYGNIKLAETTRDFMVTPLVYKPTPFLISKVVDVKEFPEFYHSLATQWFAQGKFDKALAFFKREAKQDPQRAEAFEGMMNCYINLGKKQEALNLFYSSPRRTVNMYFLAGKLLYEEGKINEAISVLNQGYRRNSVDLRIINLLAEAYLSKGNKENARLLLKRSLEIDPNQDIIKKKLESLR